MSDERPVLTLTDQLAADQADELVVSDINTTRLIIFNRPAARNALTNAMKAAIVAHLADAANDDSIRTVVVTGAHGAFSAGADIKELRAGAPRIRHNPAEALRAFPKPVIAAVDGPCATGALEVALSCSFILASRRARFADTHAKVGLIAGWGMSALLPRAIGRRRASQIMSTGEFIDATTAYEWGLVNEVVDGDVTARAVEIAGQMAANPRASVEAQIRAMIDGEGASLGDALAIEERMKEMWRAGKPDLFASDAATKAPR
ncbi:enoyl-CoA hydratase-related protein [Sphingopyxis sp. 113P3]|uniref:enoyl-CoA hydratase-related protein n=1 Tax=Sphingopyxis sp. (strain 113P3) TaxID=292913 RepID=UPI0006AD2D70|nr:enoyl-CoA hydratase-related protein [Sphingopyxis sp. 113P3]ALC14122.1 enoyl-CoA hydratase [Sphingopyxis sp. 113P3]